MTFVLELPWPPSVNDANRIGKNRKTGKPQMFGNPEKLKFIREADILYLMQKRHTSFVAGEFTYHITLNEQMRGPTMDGDNRGKYVLDFLQRVGLIENDKLAHGGSWSWGACEYGCRIIVKPYQQEQAA
jgi:Holliday junction resolvase RusA-like endonuclease